MLIKSNRKKQIFSKRKDAEKFALDLETEYIEKKETTDEGLETAKTVHTHVIMLKVPIDKVAAIKNKSMFIEGFACKSAGKLKAKLATMDGFNDKDSESVNFAIENSELLARDDHQSRLQDTMLVKLFGIDIGSTILASIRHSDVIDKNKPYIDIFGYKENIVLEKANNLTQKKDKNSERSDLNYLTMRKNNKNSGKLAGSKAIEIARLTNLSKSAITKFNFKKEFNGYLRSGIDPAKIISKSFYSSQTLDQLVKGRLQKDFKTKEDLGNFANKFHKLVEVTVSSKPKSFAIKRSKIAKIHESIAVKIEIDSNLIESYGSNIFDVIVYAKNSERRILDYYILKIDLSKLMTKSTLIQQSLDLKKHEMMSQRSSINTAILKISNDTSFNASYNILQATFGSKSLRNKYFFESVSKTEVSSKKSLYAFERSNGIRLSKEKSYFYRMKVAYPEMSFDNTLFDCISQSKKNSRKTGPYVDIICINDSDKTLIEKQESVEITIKNFPFDCIALNIVKRNLTKKERDFKLIKNLLQDNVNLEKDLNSSLLELKEQKTVFLKKKSQPDKLVFIDNDIEEGDVYEYKTLVYRDNCDKEHSINSYEMKYEKRKNIVDVILSLSSDNSDQQDNNNTIKTSMTFTVSAKKNVIDELFESLGRNSYELFSKEFDEIKESLSKNISCSVTLINTSTGDQKDLGNFIVSEDKTITVNAEINDIFSNYKIIVKPRIASISYVIENMLNKMNELPSLQRSMSIAPFLRTLQTRRNKNKANAISKNIISSVPISKYTGKSVRFFGLILDPVTKFNQEGEDFYFEGTTGDNFIFDIHDSSFLKPTATLNFTSLVDLTYSQKAHGSKAVYKKLAILKMKSSTGMSLLTNFYAIYSKSNGALTFLGMISPEKFDKQHYNFCADLGETIGQTEIICVTVLKDGTFLEPKNIANLLCNTKSIKAI